MIAHPAVVAHGAGDATLALSIGFPVTLISAPGAALAGGCLWWRALVDLARAAHPATPCLDILDCGDSPGQAMAAVRSGQRVVVLSPASPAFAAVAAAAVGCGARVMAARPAALDLAKPGASRRLPDWLETPAPPPVTGGRG